MNWNQLQSLFDGQGLFFWAAVTAVALGLTMLSVSIVFQVRKLLERTSWPKWHRRRSGVPTQPADKPQVVVTADGYRANHLAKAPPAPASADSDPLLENLLARLKKSGDRLELLHSSLEPRGTSAQRGSNSLLKGPPEEVDYVYQAGRA